VTETWRPELTRLPRYTVWRRAFRGLIRALARTLVFTCTRCTVRGLENFPRKGPFIVVTNHLGDADAVLEAAFFPIHPDALAKIELYDFPVLGWVMDAFGVIWLHRGQPDRRALEAAIEALRQGRVIGIAPEGRESLTGSLEQGCGGAAFLALKADVPIIPVALTGTEHVYRDLRRLRRAAVTLTVGEPFRLAAAGDRREAFRLGTRQIMETLARLLPPEYRGAYRSEEGR